MATDLPAKTPSPARKRVRSKAIDGLNASRMRPSRTGRRCCTKIRRDAIDEGDRQGSAELQSNG